MYDNSSNVTPLHVCNVHSSQNIDGNAQIYMGDMCANEQDVTTDIIGCKDVHNILALDGSTGGTVGYVLHRRRQRRMEKKYSQLLEGIVR